MKITRARVISAKTCGGLLDGLDVRFRSEKPGNRAFEPICLVGPNGSGKSQLLQVLVEMFQSLFARCVKEEERVDCNPELLFELEYSICPAPDQPRVSVAVRRQEPNRLTMSRRLPGGEWEECDLLAADTHQLLPAKIVGYTSGDNETLSLPFLVSRSGYADEVSRKALGERADSPTPETRLMLVDYGTHLEVLVANLLMSGEQHREELLSQADLSELHSFRCIVQLNHSSVKTRKEQRRRGRKGVQLTDELEKYLDELRRCSTCYNYDEKKEVYVFDFLLCKDVRAAFRSFWTSALDLYTSFHKLAMLNDLVISRDARKRFQSATKNRHFASRLPEPQDEEKVFRFERVAFTSRKSDLTVDYVSLSDGEHQLIQLLGIFCMFSMPNVLFVLDEPESHFNPQWRVEFISKLADVLTAEGTRRGSSDTLEQECLLTTHAPFVPSDMKREQVMIFNKEQGSLGVRRPSQETFGSTFDSILETCFGVYPPISQRPRDRIESLMDCDDINQLKDGIRELGDSLERAILTERLIALRNRGNEAV